MIDVIRILATIVLGYLLFLSALVLLAKFFFPFMDTKKLKGELLNDIVGVSMEKVLVVDDEIDICVLLSKHLQKKGAKADYALNFSDAVSMAEQCHYNLYIIDLNLAGSSGYDLVAKLKTMKRNAKIIMISAHDSEAENAIHKGADYFVPKPLSKSSINEALEQIKFTY